MTNSQLKQGTKYVYRCEDPTSDTFSFANGRIVTLIQDLSKAEQHIPDEDYPWTCATEDGKEIYAWSRELEEIATLPVIDPMLDCQARLAAAFDRVEYLEKKLAEPKPEPTISIAQIASQLTPDLWAEMLRFAAEDSLLNESARRHRLRELNNRLENCLARSKEQERHAQSVQNRIARLERGLSETEPEKETPPYPAPKFSPDYRLRDVVRKPGLYCDEDDV